MMPSAVVLLMLFGRLYIVLPVDFDVPFVSWNCAIAMKEWS